MERLAKKLLRAGEDPRDQAVRKRLGTLGSGVGVVVNLLLTAVKLFVGMVTGSVAVTSDAVNNLSDAAGSVVSLVTMRMAQKPTDKEHPFGHGRAEYIGALAVGVMILFMGVEILRTGVRSIMNPEPLALNVVTFVLLVLSVLAKGGLYLFYTGVGRLIDYSSLLAAAKDSLSDMLATTAVVISTVAAMIWDFPIDGIMGVLVALLVFRAGFDVVRDMLDNLLGGRPDPELGREIIRRLMRYESILGTHDLLVHDYGPGRCFASIHAEVPADGDLLQLHEMIDLAEREIGEALNVPLCIHMDPIVTGDAKTDEAAAHLTAALAEMGSGYMLHDLRMVPGENRTNLVFDVAVPAGCKERKRITDTLAAAARELDERYECVIHYDIDFYHE
ncbi:MAG: cation transporter [Clostridia bacterium]|nr:cation transporter [Clostridia bacterium]